MATETNVKTTTWRLVQVGRVVLTEKKLAVIVEIIDQKRALIDGPHIQRQAIGFSKITLTPLVLADLSRGSRTATVEKKWKAADIDGKWEKTSWAKKIARKERRAQLTDFERFQVMVLKKQRNYAVKKALAKA